MSSTNKYQIQFRSGCQNMGASQTDPKEQSEKTNQHFLRMTVSPSCNKLTAEVYVHSIIILNKWAAGLEKMTHPKPEHILLPRYYKIVERSTCSESMRLEIEFDCYHIQLSKQLTQRGEGSKYLQEAEMWYLLYCLVQSASTCHGFGQPIGDVKPSNIWLNNEGKLKILSSLSLPLKQDLYEGKKFANSLYSPEQLQNIKRSYKEYNLDYIPSESFSIGMTLLSAGTIQGVERCYNYQKSQLNMLEFNKLLTFWCQNQFYSETLQQSTRYSKPLKDIVLRMLEMKPELRMTSLQVYDLLKPYKDSIMQLQPFEVHLSRTTSPKKRSGSKNNSNSNSSIHVLRSRKRSMNKQSNNNSKMEVSNFLSRLNNVQFSFTSPVAMKESEKKKEESPSPQRKKKITTSYMVTNQKGETFK